MCLHDILHIIKPYELERGSSHNYELCTKYFFIYKIPLFSTHWNFLELMLYIFTLFYYDITWY